MYSHFQQLRTIDANTSALSNDVGRIDQVLEDLLVHIRQRARPRSLLPHTRVSSRFGKRAPLGDEHDMAIRKLLLQLSCQPIRGYESKGDA
jgi:hypothetical protein